MHRNNLLACAAVAARIGCCPCSGESIIGMRTTRPRLRRNFVQCYNWRSIAVVRGSRSRRSGHAGTFNRRISGNTAENWRGRIDDRDRLRPAAGVASEIVRGPGACDRIAQMSATAAGLR